MPVRRRSRKVRGTSVNCSLFAVNATLGYQVEKMVSKEIGERMVRERKAQRVYSGDVFLGYQRTKVFSLPKMRESDQSNAGISANEMHAIVGLHGESFTASLTEVQRERRVKRGLREMDDVEAARVKFEQYQYAH